MGPFNFSSLLSQRQFKFNVSKQTHCFFFQACSFSSVHECIHFWSCYHNLPQPWWLQTTKLALTVLETTSLKSSLPQKVRSRGQSSLGSSSFWWLPVFLACGCIILVSSSIFTWSSLLLLVCLKSPSAFLLEDPGKIQDDFISRS